MKIKKEKKMYKIGSLVKWYEHYADESVIKDAGYGIILKINEHQHLGYTNYLIYRNVHSDTMVFSPFEIEA